MQKSMKKIVAFLLAFVVAVSVITTGSLTSEAASVPTVTYRVHVQKDGWKQGWVKNGKPAGTTGEAKRLEAIQIKVEGDKNLGIEYKTHIQSIGWEKKFSANGGQSGTVGAAKRLEAIRIKLTGSDAGKYDVYYRVHAQSYGWLGWAKNGQSAGTAGQAKRLESIQIQILPKGTLPSEGSFGCAFVDLGKKPSMTADGAVKYSVHVQTYGDQKEVCDGAVAGTFGEAKRLEGIKIKLDTTKLDIPGLTGGITYRTHVQTYGWTKGWVKDGKMSGTSHEAKRLEAIEIKLTGEVANYYDVYYRVHAQTYGWLGWAKNGQTAGSAGAAKRLEGIQICVVPKGSPAPNALPATNSYAFMSSTEKGTQAAKEVKAAALSATMTKSATMNVGATDKVKLTFAPTSVTNKRVVYTSSDESVATVDATGKVTAVKAGTATIKVTTTDGSKKSATVKVTVVKAVTKIEAKNAEISLGVGDTAKAEVIITPVDATNTSLTYTSKTPDVVTVNENGTITAVGRGKGYIEVVSKADPTKVTSIVVNVTEKKATEVAISDNARVTLTFTGKGQEIVNDLNDAVAHCYNELKDLENEDWTAETSDGVKYTVKYADKKVTYTRDGKDVTDKIAAETADKTLKLTASVNSGKASKVINAAEAIQNAAKYEKNLTATLTMVGTSGKAYTVDKVAISSKYSNATIAGKQYKVFFQNGKMYVAGDVTKDQFFVDLGTQKIASVNYVEVK